MNGILYGQNITPSDTSGVWYSYRQDVNCLRCLMQESKKDSIISIRETQTTELRESLDGCVSTVNDQRLELMLKDDEIVKLKSHRKILLFTSGGLLAVVALFIWL